MLGGATALRGADFSEPVRSSRTLVQLPGTSPVIVEPGLHTAFLVGPGDGPDGTYDGPCTVRDTATGEVLAGPAAPPLQWKATKRSLAEAGCDGTQESTLHVVGIGHEPAGLDVGNVVRGTLTAIVGAALSALVAATGIARLRRHQARSEVAPPEP